MAGLTVEREVYPGCVGRHIYQGGIPGYIHREAYPGTYTTLRGVHREAIHHLRGTQGGYTPPERY